ncbi:MAG TPA: thermonuclease family protein [Pyrinomonadaceae bacterium]|nr:thermonuclease family protein [Pyrinomonadaceae bacterium]
MRRILAIAFLALLCLSLKTDAKILIVSVVEVQDGRTIIVENSGRRMKVILKAVESPELDQPMGEVARKHLADLILGKQVSVELTGMDYGSRFFIAKVFSSEVDVSLQMIRDGAAWFDRQYEKETTDEALNLYVEAERAARSESRGIWSDPQPVPPWEWRQAKAAEQKSQTAAPAPIIRASAPRVRENKAWPMLSLSGAPFAIRMPGGGQQFSTEVRLPSGDAIKVNIYEVSHLKIGYIAIWASGPKGDATLDALFDKTMDNLNRVSATRGLSCEFTRNKDTTLSGYVGRRYVVHDCYYHGAIRLYFKVEGKTLKACLVGVLGQNPNDPSINEFLESFVLNED